MILAHTKCSGAIDQANLQNLDWVSEPGSCKASRWSSSLRWQASKKTDRLCHPPCTSGSHLLELLPCHSSGRHAIPGCKSLPIAS